MSRLLLEIGTEAIPAGYVAPALAALEDSARAGLAELRLGTQSVRAVGTAKRLVLEVRGLAARQEDLTREVTGPRADAAFRDGKPTPAAEGFARKNGVAVDALERVTTDKGEFVMVRVHETGRDAGEVLAGTSVETRAGTSLAQDDDLERYPIPVPAPDSLGLVSSGQRGPAADGGRHRGASARPRGTG